MKALYLSGALACVSALTAAGCGESANSSTTANVSRATNTSNTAVVTNANNSVGSNVANSISNAVSSATTSSPEEFMKEAAAGGMNEVELGKLAATKASSPEVKKFGQMMVTDHTKANTELKALAAKKGVQLPTELDSSGKSMMDDLKGQSGTEFDAAYIEGMVSDHSDTVESFQKQAQNATDPDVKAFAAKTLPTLKNHLETVKALQAKMK